MSNIATSATASLLLAGLLLGLCLLDSSEAAIGALRAPPMYLSNLAATGGYNSNGNNNMRRYVQAARQFNPVEAYLRDRAGGSGGDKQKGARSLNGLDNFGLPEQFGGRHEPKPVVAAYYKRKEPMFAWSRLGGFGGQTPW